MIVIIDYGLGNLTSVSNALKILKIEHKISDKEEDIRNTDKLILPGVGAFKHGINNLSKKSLIPILNEEILIKKKPILGICLGMQLMCKKSHEGGEFAGLGWLDAEVINLKFENKDILVPHVGWNDVDCDLTSPLFKGGNKIRTFYFVHSYYLKPFDKKMIIGTCNYKIDFCAVIQKENIFATQFHPEKSQMEGLNLLKNFNEYKNNIKC